jgi:hypothetical protein
VLTIGRTLEDAKVAAVAGNEFRLSDLEQTERVVSTAKRGARMSWTYAAADGPATAQFGLRGLSAALKWIECMGQAATGPELGTRPPLDFTPEPAKGEGAKRFSSSLAARYRGITNPVTIAADLRGQGLDCSTPAGAAGVTECQKIAEVPNTACFDVWRASHDIDDSPPVRGDYARRCMGAIPSNP